MIGLGAVGLFIPEMAAILYIISVVVWYAVWVCGIVCAFRDGDTHGVILHADRGCQYTSQQLHDAAEALNVRLSVGRTGVCWDNAQQESFWSTLKTEFYHRYQFTTHAAAIHGVTEWIETVYNRRRRHSALGYFTPVAFEHHITTAAQAA